MSMKLSKEEVLKRLIGANPNFCYSEFEYINCETKSKITCDKGHIFYKSLELFKEHPSCPECFKENRKVKSTKALTESEALKRLYSKYPTYNFLSFRYKNIITKSIIICDKGHQYESSYHNTYIKGRKCPYCAGMYKTEKQVKEELQKIHPTYDFTYFKYKRNNDKSIVICDKGHIFKSSYENMKISKCPKCAKNRKKSVEEMRRDMQELEPNYDFSLFDAKNTSIPSIVTCNNSHTYNVRYNDFMSGVRCSKCYHKIKGEKQTRTQEEVIFLLKEAEPNYDFSKFIYYGTSEKSKIICGKGHEYLGSFNSFISACCRCPYCANQKSKPEYEIIDYIKTFFKNEIQQGNRKIIKSPFAKKKVSHLELDIYIPDLKLAFEYNGAYWHSDEKIERRTRGYFKTSKEFHEYKTNECLKKGIHLIHIDEKDYKNNKDEVLNNIKYLISSKQIISKG